MDNNEREVLEEIAKWLRFIGMQEARGVVETALNYESDEKERDAKITYQLTDGTQSTHDIEDYISYSYKWVSNRHQEWAKLGIVEKDGPLDSYEHIMSLDALGIKSPNIPEPNESAGDKDNGAESEENDTQSTLEAE